MSDDPMADFLAREKAALGMFVFLQSRPKYLKDPAGEGG